MSACSVFAEIVVTTAESTPPGAIIATATTMCFYAPQTCTAVPYSFGADASMQAYARLLRYSLAFKELNVKAWEKGCRLVISAVDERQITWRMILVTADSAKTTLSDAERAASKHIKETKVETERWWNFFNTPEGLKYLMDRLSNR